MQHASFAEFLLLMDAGFKAWLKAVQAFEDAKQLLHMCQLHMVCNSRDDLVMCASEQLQVAMQKLVFRVNMAVEKGEPKDLGPWAKLADNAGKIHLLASKLAGKVKCRWGILGGPGKAHRLQQPPSSCSLQAASSGLPKPVAAAAGSSPAIIQRPIGEAMPEASGMPHQASTCSESPADAQKDKEGSAQQTGKTACPPVDPDGDAQFWQAEASRGATPSCVNSEADPADIHSPPAEDQGPIADALAILGLPRSRAWVEALPVPDVMFTPHNLEAAMGPFEQHDPNLIIWNPEDGSAAWIDPKFHLNRQCLSQMAHAYFTAQVLIETDSDGDLQPAAPSVQRSILEEMDPSSLEAFAVAGIIDILAMAVCRDLGHQLPDMPQQDPGEAEDEVGFGIWSRRLVYCRHLN